MENSKLILALKKLTLEVGVGASPLPAVLESLGALPRAGPESELKE